MFLFLLTVFVRFVIIKKKIDRTNRVINLLYKCATNIITINISERTGEGMLDGLKFLNIQN